jgi:hypothetical protein
VSDKVEALREALYRYAPSSYPPELGPIFAAANILADNPDLYEMLEAGAEVERTWLCIERDNRGLAISNLPGSLQHCFFLRFSHLPDCGPVLIVKEPPQ